MDAGGEAAFLRAILWYANYDVDVKITKLPYIIAKFKAGIYPGYKLPVIELKNGTMLG